MRTLIAFAILATACGQNAVAQDCGSYATNSGGNCLKFATYQVADTDTVTMTVIGGPELTWVGWTFGNAGGGHEVPAGTMVTIVVDSDVSAGTLQTVIQGTSAEALNSVTVVVHSRLVQSPSRTPRTPPSSGGKRGSVTTSSKK